MAASCAPRKRGEPKGPRRSPRSRPDRGVRQRLVVRAVALTGDVVLGHDVWVVPRRDAALGAGVGGVRVDELSRTGEPGTVEAGRARLEVIATHVRLTCQR